MEQTFEEKQEILNAQIKEVEEIYNDILKKVEVQKVDALISEYAKEISSLRGGTLSNDRIAYYLQLLGYHSYRLSTAYTRQSLSSVVTKVYVEVEESKLFLSSQTEESGKLTRDDKRAIAIVKTEHERVFATVLKRAEHAIEQRLNEVHSLMDTMKTMSMINMSEAKKTGGNF